MPARKYSHKLTCEYCGKYYTNRKPILKRKDGSYTLRKYCSMDCFHKARETHIKTCQTCGKQFKPKNNVGVFKYCSKECTIGVKRAERETITCKTCGKEFEIYTHRHKHGNPKYCSEKCSHAPDPNTYTFITCERCGGQRKVSRHYLSIHDVRFCSKECKKLPEDRKRRLGLASWENIREQILIRDRYMCKRCGQTHSLVVHHIVRWARTRDDSPNNLITLCRTCHPLVERGVIPCPSI